MFTSPWSPVSSWKQLAGFVILAALSVAAVHFVMKKAKLGKVV
jgi:hypothetical protein